MSIVNTDAGEVVGPSVPIRLITPDDVRASVKRAKKSLEEAAEEIVWQVEVEAWKTLQYSSWDAMREAEYGGTAFMVPGRQRPELVARMRRSGLTQQEIADTAGVAKSTVQEDLKADIGFQGSRPEPEAITNSRGQQRPASYRRQPERDPEPPAPPRPLRLTPDELRESTRRAGIRNLTSVLTYITHGPSPERVAGEYRDVLDAFELQDLAFAAETMAAIVDLKKQETI